MKDFHSGTEGLICQKNCEGWMVGAWEGLNLGSIPNDHMPSQTDPKISIERRCSTILPRASEWGKRAASECRYEGANRCYRLDNAHQKLCNGHQCHSHIAAISKPKRNSTISLGTGDTRILPVVLLRSRISKNCTFFGKGT